MRKCLAFLKAGQKLWTYIDIEDYCRFSDVIFYKGLVYAVGEWNDIVSFDLSNLKDEKVIPNVVSSKGDDYSQRVYLVKSLEGDLWLIRRFIDFPDDFDEDDEEDDDDDSSGTRRSGTRRFEVYKLEYLCMLYISLIIYKKIQFIIPKIILMAFLFLILRGHLTWESTM
ncbi:unnamed protein product [Trifolium pratense]|uniref:Uncharacterized protein n=1 Tax=Trifolium pratense TaxID=57577 RepID=A0ACB0J6P1_TRIPR|nr:unnamed protein product [Trifolium pratense]